MDGSQNGVVGDKRHGEWRAYTGRQVTVYALEGSYATKHAPASLQEAEQTLAALEEMLKPAAKSRELLIDISLIDPVAELPSGGPDAGARDGATADQAVDIQADTAAWLEDATGQRWHLNPETRIGHSASNDVQLAGPTVSHYHAVIRRHGDQHLLSDLGSSNGTFVNERLIFAPHALQPGDRIRFAQVEVAFHGAGRAPPTQKAIGRASIVREVQPDVPAEPLIRPLTRLALHRWSGQGAASAPLFVDGIAGVVAARIGCGPPIQEADDCVRGELADGCPISIVSGSFAAGIQDPSAFERAATSFVAFLIESFGEDTLRKFLTALEPDRRDQAALATYYRPLGGLEELWLASLRRRGSDVALRSFLHHLAPLIKPYWRRELEIMAYMMVELGYGLALALSSKYVVDTIIPSHDTRNLALIIIALLGLYVVESLVGMRRVYVNTWVNQRVLIGLREQMFAHLQRLPHSFYNEAKIGDVMARLSHDLDVVERAMEQIVGVGVFLALKALATAVVLIVLSPLLGSLVLVVVPLFAVGYLVLHQRLEQVSYALQKLTGEAETTEQENLSAHAVIKAFGLEEHAISTYHARLMALLRMVARLTLIGALFEVSLSLAITVGELVVLGVGGYLVILGHATIGTLLAFIGLLGSLFQPVAMIATVGQTLQQASGALERVTELLDEPVTIADQPGAVTLSPLSREIRLEHVSFGYVDSLPILQDLDLTIPAGAHVAIVGPTGAGKSTIAHLLLRFWDPRQGHIRFDGRDLRDVTLASLRGQIGLVFQDAFIFDTTVRENIAIGRPGATDAEVAAAAAMARIDRYIDSLPAGYDTTLGERGVRMSGGQRQRLALARALLRDPRVLILDEPTSALDAQTEREILEILAETAGHRTTISITHRLSLAASADRIFVLDQGRLVEHGTHAELVQAGGIYQRLYAEQTRHVPGGPYAEQGDCRVVSRLSTFSTHGHSQQENDY